MANAKKGDPAPAIEHVLDSLQLRRRRLDEADTTISNLIKDVETQLQTHINIRVWIDITEPDKSYEQTLAFGKHDGKWQLVVEADFPDGSSDKTPLLSCTRETRVRVFADGHVEALIRGAVEQLDQMLTVREKAVDKASELVRALGGITF